MDRLPESKKTGISNCLKHLDDYLEQKLFLSKNDQIAKDLSDFEEWYLRKYGKNLKTKPPYKKKGKYVFHIKISSSTRWIKGYGITESSAVKMALEKAKKKAGFEEAKVINEEKDSFVNKPVQRKTA